MGVATCRLAPYTSSTYISLMLTNKKPLEWIGSSHKNSMALPAVVRRLFGFALSLAQSGDKHDAAKVLKGFVGAGVYLRWWKTMLAAPTAPCTPSSLLRQCSSFIGFQKKSKRGMATPKEDMDIIHAGLKIAEAYVKELRK